MNIKIKNAWEKVKENGGKFFSKLGKAVFNMIISYLVAIITIVLIYVFDNENFLQSAENIFFSTGACYLMSTYLSIRTVDIHEKSEFLTGLLMIGLVICLSINAVTVTNSLPSMWGLVSAVISSLICLVLGYKYVCVDSVMEKVLQHHNENYTIAKADYIKQQRMTPGTTDYFDGNEYHF